MKSREDIQAYFVSAIRKHHECSMIAMENYTKAALSKDMEAANIWIKMQSMHEARLSALDFAQYYIFSDEA